MKRKNDLFGAIVDFHNLRNAWLKAIRGKRKSFAVVIFSRNISENLHNIRKRFLSNNPGWGNYRSFTLFEPKKREIFAASFEERVMHHAIMNILEPIFGRHLIYHCYACRKGKGMHAAVQYAFKKTKVNHYYLKLDVRKYFDSIDHSVVKSQIVKIIKDKRTLFLLFGIIDSYNSLSGRGLPIGNLTSQFFANLYLSFLDHYVLEHLKPAGYVRYMDDFALWHNDKHSLKAMLGLVDEYASTALKLELKPPVLGHVTQGLPFLGFSIKPTGIFLLQKSKRRMQARAKEIQSALNSKKLTEEQAAERANSVNAALLIARSHAFRVRLWNGSGLGHEPCQTRR